jgi:hypothetical protein
MTSKPDNPKSDVPAKRAFVEYLLKEKEASSLFGVGGNDRSCLSTDVFRFG